MSPTTEGLRVVRTPDKPLSVGYDRLSGAETSQEQRPTSGDPRRRFGAFDQNRTTRPPSDQD